MAYPATTSCRPAPEAVRSSRIAGMATLTIERSSTAMNCPPSTTASSRPRDGETGGVVMAPASAGPGTGVECLRILVPPAPGTRMRRPARWRDADDDVQGRAGRVPALAAGQDQPRRRG